ncbi:MAG: hypothetical protein LBP85_06335 [Prevotellaceae bacterium]|jgi:hypothetical protein|nr:hypothetical protein [Prevotellaceae bacterium]
MVNKYNETAPFMLDEDIRLDSMIALPDKTLESNLTFVNFSIDEIDIKAFEE